MNDLTGKGGSGLMVTGSFCTFSAAIRRGSQLRQPGAELTSFPNTPPGRTPVWKGGEPGGNRAGGDLRQKSHPPSPTPDHWG